MYINWYLNGYFEISYLLSFQTQYIRQRIVSYTENAQPPQCVCSQEWLRIASLTPHPHSPPSGKGTSASGFGTTDDNEIDCKISLTRRTKHTLFPYQLFNTCTYMHYTHFRWSCCPTDMACAAHVCTNSRKKDGKCICFLLTKRGN